MAFRATRFTTNANRCPWILRYFVVGLFSLMAVVSAAAQERDFGGPTCTTAGPVEVQSSTGTAAGVPTAYANLGTAFTAINAGALHTGVITIEICANTTETGSAVLNSSGAGSASYTSINIAPLVDGVLISGPTVTGRGLIELNGADNVTIDGDNPITVGTNRNLTIQNTAADTTTFTSVIRIALAATGVTSANNDTVRNAIILGSATGRNIAAATAQAGSEFTTYGILVGGGADATTATNPPAAITSVTTVVGSPATALSFSVSNSQIDACARGVAVQGSATTVANNLSVTGNTIGNAVAGNPTTVYARGMTLQGFDNATIARNTVRNIETFVNTQTMAISLGDISASGQNAIVERNTVNRVFNRNVGTFGAYGINVNAGNTNTIRNNFVSDITHDMTGGIAFSTLFGNFGIRLGTGTGHKVYHNSVYMFGLMPGTPNSSLLTASLGVAATTLTGLDIRNNILVNDTTGGTTSIAHVALFLPSAGTSAMNLTLNNNDYYNSAAPAANQGVGQAGTTAGTNFFTQANFDPTATSPATNMRAYTSTLSVGGANDNASKKVDPLFISATDLHIVGGSPMVDAGAAVGVSNDFDGQLRVPPPDIGGDEPGGVAPPPNDMQATAFITPTNGGNVSVGTPFSPQASFTNNGTATQTSVTVRYRIVNPSAVEVYNQTMVIASIASNQTVVVTFPSTSLTINGIHTIQASSELAGDAIPANDTINGTVTAFAPLTLLVNTTNDTQDVAPGNGICADGAGECSLRAAISEANANPPADTITLPAGTYTQSLVAANEDANAGGDYDINGDLTINGAGSATTIIQAAATPGTATERVMEIPGTAVVVISGVTLRHGNKTGAVANTTRGGGIRNVGTLTMNNSIVTLNNASGSGGVRNENIITLNGVTVSNNNCNNGGATCFGGGMYNTLTTNATVTITNSTFSGNTSNSPGANGFGFAAGLGIEGAAGFSLVISGSSFTNNQGIGTGTGGSNGNGIRMLPTAASTANITNTSFTGNFGTGGSSIQGSGITLFTSGAGTLTGTWDQLTVNGNTANGAGSGIFIDATGGAATVNLTRSTVSNNTGGTSGGGISLTNVGGTAASSITMNIVNSTISGNIGSGTGGGFFSEQPTAGIITTNFNFATIAKNTAATGGGIGQTGGTVNLKNSIVGDNTATTGPDISGAVTSQNYNHIENLTGATITGTTTNNATGDASLAPLGNYGGPTQTHLPTASSPVLNTIPNGTNDCGTVIVDDQRLFARPRPVGQGCDKGSVEVNVPTAAGVTVSGRVITSEGRGLTNAVITISDANGVIQSLITGRNGAFSFEDIAPGHTYVVAVRARRYSFAPRTVEVTDNVTGLVFTPDDGSHLGVPDQDE